MILHTRSGTAAGEAAMRFISKESAFIIGIGLLGVPAYQLWMARMEKMRQEERAREAAARRRPGRGQPGSYR